MEAQQTLNLTENLKKLTELALKTIALDMEDPSAMLKNARHYKDIATTLEKMANVLTKINKLEKDTTQKSAETGYVDNSTPREKREILEATVNYYEGQKERIKESLEYLKKLEAEEGEDLDIFDPRNPCDRRPPSIFDKKEEC